jgi:hypothetical protein
MAGNEHCLVELARRFGIHNQHQEPTMNPTVFKASSTVFLASVAVGLALSAPPGAAVARAPASLAAVELEPGTRLLSPIRYQALAVFPVVTAGSPAAAPANYLTLADGLARKVVTVSERGGGGDVNHVQVANRSDRPLMLLGGQVILGGQQDRILGKDTMVPARERATVEVFCVEHGRWSGGRNFGSTAGIVENKTRLRAKYRSDQGQVWDGVARKTAALGAGSSTGTYRQLAEAPAGETAIKPYRENVTRKLVGLPEAAQMVGLVGAINGPITSVEIFASPGLFAAYRGQLLDSLYVTAADVRESPAAAAPPTLDAIKTFIGKAEAAPAETVSSGKVSRTVEKKDREVLNSTLEWAPDATAPPRPIYKSYQSNE